jgi:hypothetical protein
MYTINCLRLVVFLSFQFIILGASSQERVKIIEADNPYIQLYGRFDKSNPKLPRFWAPGTQIVTRFSGSDCEIFLNDQVVDGAHNYIEVKVDNIEPVRIQLRARANRIQIAKDLPGGNHTVTITKNTEAGVGYLELVGFICNSLLPPPPVPVRKIAFIGDDVTAGRGIDDRYMPCDSAEWFDQSSAYHSYAAISARDLNAQVHITAASEIGVMKAAGEPGGNMPSVYDKLNVHRNAGDWDDKNYQPLVLAIYLGRNDPINDSAAFVNQYVAFLKQLRTKYPSAQLVAISGNEGAGKEATFNNYIKSVVASAVRAGDKRVQHLAIQGIFQKGCGKLPSLDEHVAIASQVTAFVKRIVAW